ncbi:related to DNA damage-responsive protein 48 [Cephalotrichum gorgonifer]|uniref:Related to DNA damage-responsive protein 48 n=1 Tax=Cephalotrichum gorgonifer TaxID=2041049 RepID=A0AAE8MTX4_9PEZI|nr:related to DNA damage-responsive protein 48 [Cephalotrichum gorgonifer]
MDFINKVASQAQGNQGKDNQSSGGGLAGQLGNLVGGQGQGNQNQSNQSSGGGLAGQLGNLVGGQGQGNQSGGGIGDKLNNLAGGGQKGEKDEDLLDKAVDYVQEKYLGKGPQDNESAAEQAKDEQISDAIRKGYKSATGSDFPLQDKDKKFGF